MTVAVVSSNGKVINQHFRNASRFLIFEVDYGEIQFIEIREARPLCGSAAYGNKEDALCRIIDLIKDCEAGLCARMGENQEKN